MAYIKENDLGCPQFDVSLEEHETFGGPISDDDEYEAWFIAEEILKKDEEARCIQN